MTIHRSPYPDLEIPDVALTPFVLEHAAEHADKPALIDGPSGRTLTYGQFADAVKRFAGGLQERGFAEGECVALFMPNLPEYGVAFHGTAWAGGVVTTINPVYGVDEVCFQLKDSKARFLVTVEPSLDTARKAAEQAGVEQVFVVGQDLPDGEPLSEPVDRGPDAVVALPYSSGTTGLPKGVMLTNRNLVANILQTVAIQQPSDEDTVIGVLPFFHIYGMQVIMNCTLRSGGTIVTMPRFDLEQFLRLIQEHAVTRAYVVPPIALALARHPAVDQFDTSSLNFVMSGAAPLGAELEDECRNRLGGALVLQGYGMTETSPVTHCIPMDPDAARPGSIGPALANTECRIVVLEEDRDAEPGERGELWIRGPQIMAGYLNNDEATRATIDDEGWLHTGDVAIVDEDGYFAIVDRVKELIKYKGFQVAPAELEALLVQHPCVADAAVIPVPDEEAGEIPKAFLVLRGEVSEDDIKAFVADKVATYKQVRAIEFVDEIPKSQSGKILRRVLRDRESATA
jgi:acyl-CoA synthetase (AMP-forming)/AMP-acid ligase II